MKCLKFNYQLEHFFFVNFRKWNHEEVKGFPQFWDLLKKTKFLQETLKLHIILSNMSHPKVTRFDSLVIRKFFNLLFDVHVDLDELCAMLM